MSNLILADHSASISELKANPSKVVRDAEGPIAILNRNTPEFYCVPAKHYEWLLENLENLELAQLAAERLADGEAPRETTIDELKRLYGTRS